MEIQKIYGDVVVYNGNSNFRGKADEMIAKDVSEVLMKHYPKYTWLVNCCIRDGMVTILLGDVISQYGYKARIAEFENDPEMRLIVKAGGEILERFMLSRSRKIDGQAEDLKSVAGRTAFDYNGMKNERHIPKSFKKMLEKARK